MENSYMVNGHMFLGEYKSDKCCIICGAWWDEAETVSCARHKKFVTVCSNVNCIVTNNYGGIFDGSNPYCCPDCIVLYAE